MKDEDQKDFIWALIYSKAKEENRAKLNLERQGFKIFLPRIELEGGTSSFQNTSSVHFMFPRYLFVRINLQEGNWSSINSTRGVSNLVFFGGKIATVSIKFIQYLQEITDKDDIFRQQIKMTEFSHGDKLVIKEGIFKGMNGIFISKQGKKRVKILLETLTKAIQIDLPSENVGKKKIQEKLKL